jgi:polar amino acid transport system substrate-binding protein
MKRLLASLFCGLSLALSASAEERNLHIASTNFPPYYGPELREKGFVSEVITEAFANSGYGVNIEFFPWKRAYEGTKLGDYDALFTVWHRPEREEWFHFSDPLPPNEVGFFRRQDREIPSISLEALSDYLIGTVRGYALPPFFAEGELSISTFTDDESNLRGLTRGRVDLVLGDRKVVRHILKTKLPDSADEIVWIHPPVMIEPQHLVVPRALEDAEEIVAAFNAGLARLQDSGRITAIMQEHGF